jgi:hypothetical protein
MPVVGDAAVLYLDEVGGDEGNKAGAGNHEVVMDFSHLLKWLLGQKDSLKPRTAITAEGRD